MTTPPFKEPTGSFFSPRINNDPTRRNPSSFCGHIMRDSERRPICQEVEFRRKVSNHKGITTEIITSRLGGSCLRGRVGRSVTERFSYFGNCHCSQCRKVSGSAFSLKAASHNEIQTTREMTAMSSDRVKTPKWEIAVSKSRILRARE